MNIDDVAFRIVRECLAVKEKDMVWIETWQHTLDLTSSIVVECRKAGSVTLLTLVTDDIARRNFMDLPIPYLSKKPKPLLDALDVITCHINLGGPADPAIYQGVPSEKISGLEESLNSLRMKLAEKKIRYLYLSLGHVTPQRAQTYGFDYAGWKELMYSGMNVNHIEMKRVGEKIAEFLRNRNEVRLTAPNGTDLRFELGGRPIHIDHGVIGQEEIEKGSLGTMLPAGSVLFAPIEESAQGMVKFNLPRTFGGALIQGLTWEFKAGQVTSWSAESGFEVFQNVWNSATGDKNKIAIVLIGINPALKPIGYLTDERVLGTVSIGIGSNQGIGGKNVSNFGFSNTVSGCTMTVDGKVLIDRGQFALSESQE